MALFSEAALSDVRTFSVVFKGLDAALSEGNWASWVARRFETEHHEVEVGEEESKSWVSEAVARMDSPSVDGVNTFLVCRAVSAAGLKVAVSGQGADELFLGYRQRQMFRRLRLIAGKWPGWLTGSLLGAMSRFNSIADTRYEKVGELMAAEGEPYLAAYVAQHSIFSRSALNRLCGQPRPHAARFLRPQGGGASLNRLSRLEVAYYLRNTLLRDGDQMSMANSVELRQPFLDHGLVELVIGLPAGLKVRRGRQKPLLVDAVGKALPGEIVRRPKQGFVLPYGRWLRDGLAVSDPLATEIGLDRSAVGEVRDRFMAGAHWSRFWTLQVLCAWADRNRVRPA